MWKAGGYPIVYGIDNGAHTNQMFKSVISWITTIFKKKVFLVVIYILSHVLSFAFLSFKSSIFNLIWSFELIFRNSSTRQFFAFSNLVTVIAFKFIQLKDQSIRV